VRIRRFNTDYQLAVCHIVLFGLSIKKQSMKNFYVCSKSLGIRFGNVFFKYFSVNYKLSPSCVNIPYIKKIHNYYGNGKNLPNTLNILFLEDKFNEPVQLPSSITHLKFGDNFDQPVENLPSSITHLTFGKKFNQSIDNLPTSITHLTFESDFNQPVENLPSSITDLTFGENFNQPIDLPSSITHLTFGDKKIHIRK